MSEANVILPIWQNRKLRYNKYRQFQAEEEMTEMTTHLSHKPGAGVWIPRTRVKAKQVKQPSVTPAPERQGQGIPATLAVVIRSEFSECSFLSFRGGGQRKKIPEPKCPSKCTCTHTCAPTHANMHTHMHIYDRHTCQEETMKCLEDISTNIGMNILKRWTSRFAIIVKKLFFKHSILLILWEFHSMYLNFTHLPVPPYQPFTLVVSSPKENEKRNSKNKK